MSDNGTSGMEKLEAERDSMNEYVQKIFEAIRDDYRELVNAMRGLVEERDKTIAELRAQLEKQ